MKKISSLIRDEGGSTAATAVVVLAVFIGLLAYVVDLGHLHTVQNELRNAADACALRGARAFFPDDLSGVVQLGDPGSTPDPANATLQAHSTVGNNRSDNAALQDLPTEEIQVGIWDYDTRQLTPWRTIDSSDMGKNIGPGISLPVKRDGTHNSGPVGMTLAQLFGRPSVAVTNVRATAALSGPGALLDGYGTFPIAVDLELVKAAIGSNLIINFNPNGADVGGWTSLGPDQASANFFKGLINRTIPSPEVKMWDIINLQNGVACTGIKEAIDTYQPGNFVEKGVYRPDTPPTVWFPAVKVDTYNQSAQIAGFLQADITEFRDANAGTDPCTLKLTVVQGVAGGTPGGGPFLGTWSTEPKLVQ